MGSTRRWCGWFRRAKMESIRTEVPAEAGLLLEATPEGYERASLPGQIRPRSAPRCRDGLPLFPV